MKIQWLLSGLSFIPHPSSIGSPHFNDAALDLRLLNINRLWFPRRIISGLTNNRLFLLCHFGPF